MTPHTNSDGHVAKLQTAIPGFDAISQGGLPKGRTTLVAGSAGSAKTVLAVQYLVCGIERFGENGVFVTFEETPADIARNFRSLGWDLEKYVAQGKLAFVDASPEPGQVTVDTGPYDFSALLARIENAVQNTYARRVGIDSISALFSQFEDASVVRRELFRIAAGLKEMEVTSLLTAERLAEYGDIARYGVEEFVADSVIVLRNILENEKRRRTIEILKYRGAAHRKGEFPFTISSEGIEILPLSSVEFIHSASNTRISSGSPELDRMCGGGFYRDSIILVSGATGTGKTLMVTTFLDEGSKAAEKTLVFAFEESRDQLLRNALGWGTDFREWEEQGLLKIVCQYPEAMGLEDHLLAMKKEIDEFGPSRIAVDSLSAVERVASANTFREFVIGLTSHIKAKQAAGMFTTTSSLMGGTSVTEKHISTLTDTIILLRYVELMGQMHRGLAVLKMRGSRHDKSIRKYEIDDKGIHLGGSFRDVGGILAGTPMRHVFAEEERMGGMFGEEIAEPQSAAES